MVGGALSFRASRDKSEDEATGRNPSAKVVCATELAEMCAAAGINATVESAATTADRLIDLRDGQTADISSWVVLAPWPEIVDQARERSGKDHLLSKPTAVRRARMGLAVFPDRYVKLNAACGGQLTWKCFGEQAPKKWSDIGGEVGWGQVKIGHADPDREATGLAVLGSLLVGFFGRSDLTRIDLDDDEFRRWLTGVERSVPSFSPTAVADMLVKAPAAFDAVVTIGPLAAKQIALSARSPKPSLIYPAPMTMAQLEVAAPGGKPSSKLVDRLGKEADEQGWGPVTAAPTGMPPAGLLDAARAVWQESR